MNKRNRIIKISIVTVTLLLGLTHSLFANPIFKSELISVMKNTVNVHVKDKQVIEIGEYYKNSGDMEVPSTITYKDTNYISVKRMEEILNLKIDWDNDSRTIIINRDKFIKSSVDDIKNSLNADKLIVFYIGSPNCPACLTYAPKLNKAINKFEDIVLVSYINTKELSEEDKNYVRNTFNLKYIPVTLFIKKGEVLEKIVGDITEEFLSEKIEKVLNNSANE